MIHVAKNIQNDLSNQIARNERTMLIAVRRWFYVAHAQIRRDITTKFIKSVTSELTDWGYIEEQGQSVIKPATLKIMQSGGNTAYDLFKVKGAFDVLNVRAVAAAEKYTAKLVRDVTAETKAGIRTYISTGVKAGKSMPKLARELRPLVGLTQNQTQSVINYRLLLEDKTKFPKLTETDINRKVQRYADKTHRRRATTIARTETARAQNIGYVQGLENVGVAEAEFSASPSACERCLAHDGNRYPIKEAEGIIPVHPNGTCAMLPVIGDKPMESKTGVAQSMEAHTDKLVADLKTAGPAEGRKIQGQLRRLGKTPPDISVVKPAMPKSHFKEVSGWEDRHAAHKLSLQKQIGIDLTDLKVGSKEWKEALPAFEKSVKSFAKPTKKIPANIRRDSGLYIDAPSASLEDRVARNINKFYDKLDEIGCNDLINSYGKRHVTTYIPKAEYEYGIRAVYRANAHVKDFLISMDLASPTKTYFHELGHLLEANESIKRKAYLWLRMRGGGFGMSMPYKDICKWSDDVEMAFKDKFVNPYVGKFYDNGTTEVMSMGMEYFTNYKNMMKFARRDFDHFAFVHGVLTGAI